MEPEFQQATEGTRMIPVSWAAVLEGVRESTIYARIERGVLQKAEAAHKGRTVAVVPPESLDLSPAAHEILRAALRWRSSSDVAGEIASHVREHFGELEERRAERISRLSETAGYWKATAEAAEKRALAADETIRRLEERVEQLTRRRVFFGRNE